MTSLPIVRCLLRFEAHLVTPGTPRIAGAIFASCAVLATYGCQSDGSRAPVDGGTSSIGGSVEVPGGSGDEPVDIRDAAFENRSEDCADYVGTYVAEVEDVGRAREFAATVSVDASDETCTFRSNSIPNHDFNDGGSFATPVAEVEETFTVPRLPAKASSPVALSLEYDNGFFLNGVKLDRLAAACYGVGDQPLGEEKIGCFDSSTPWRYDPMFPETSFGTDGHNAHTQPDGAYHYHGDPLAMYDTDGRKASGVIGFAADGFPIFGPFFDDGTTIRRAVSGYELKSGSRVSIDGEGAFPGGDFDGTFVDDYEFTGSGDLDECNGMTVDGAYGYYVTDGYPWVVGCFSGTPDTSFRKAGP